METAEATTDTDDVTSNAPEVVLSPAERVEQARSIIHRNILWALGSGLVPLPVFDLVAITGIQLKMLREMSNVYGLEFSEGIAKKAVASLVAGLGGVGLGTLIAPSLVKFVPFLGTALGIVSVSLVSAAFTRATGSVYMMHFESGGNVLNFDPLAMREHFKKEFTQAVEDLKQE